MTKSINFGLSYIVTNFFRLLESSTHELWRAMDLQAHQVYMFLWNPKLNLWSLTFGLC